ncbi:hypothetical protein [Paenibacillus assamensis]|uniref:hypothetical protein n=1 Tax=Paenibacillus assamensis TaxID=311244 RepID=UPI00041956C9|nr:hypothetical protein [Paenibacillus assamensis]
MKNVFLKKSLATLLLLSVVLPATVSATPNEIRENRQLTERFNATIQYEKDLPQSTENNNNLPSKNNSTLYVNPFASLAVGESKVSNGVGAVVGAGTTKGKWITTVTSATASLWYIMVFQQPVLVSSGNKDISIGFGTAISHVSDFRPSIGRHETVTIHTATHDGVLYEQRTAAAVFYNGRPI